MRSKLVDAEAGQWAPDMEPSKRRYSEYQRALEAITAAGVEYAQRVDASLEWGDDPSIYGILEEGVNVISDLRFAVRSGEYSETDEEPLRLWSHRSQPLYDLQIKKTPSLGRQDIEAVVGSYLRLPYPPRWPDLKMTSSRPERMPKAKSVIAPATAPRIAAM